MTLRGKKILITGASSGLGRAIALRFAKDGCTLLLTARSEDKLQEVAGEVEQAGSSTFIYRCDLSDEHAVDTMCRAIEEEHGTPDMLYLNAGMGGYTRPGEINYDLVKRTTQLNFLSSVQIADRFIGGMTSRKNGVIVGVSSLADASGFPGSGAYSSTKACFSYWLEALRLELKPFGVKVITIRPGFVDTPMTRKNEFPMPFLMEPEEAAEIMYTKIAAGKTRINYPLFTSAAATLIQCMPRFIFDRLIKPQ